MKSSPKCRDARRQSSSKGYLEAQGIEVELFQESLGRTMGLTGDGLGTVQIFVPKEQAAEARQLLDEYNNAKE